jgi:membrane-associated phospholipid phosphatase
VEIPGGAVLARHTRVRSLLAELLIVLTGVVFYFGLRGLTAGSHDVAVRHAHDIVDLEKRLGMYVEEQVQDLVVPSDAMSTFFNWVYIWGHWPVIAVTLLWLALRHRTIYYRLRNGMLISGGLGLLVYTTYPVAPPRLADLGLIDTVTERSQAYRVLQPPQFVNQYAAMPSLHVGWDLLVGLAIIAAATSVWLRMVGVLMPVLMIVATIATANHYVLDAVAGIAFAMAGHLLALELERRRQRRETVEDAVEAAIAVFPIIPARPDVVPRPDPTLPTQRDGCHDGSAAPVAEGAAGVPPGR